MKIVMTIEYPFGVINDITPINTASLKHSMSRNIDTGQIFFRPKVNIDSFVGESFKILRSIFEQRGCEGSILSLYTDCSDTPIYSAIVKWSDISLNYNRCSANISIDDNDAYTCVLKNYATKTNGLSLCPKYSLRVTPKLMQDYHIEQYVGQGNWPVAPAGYLFVGEYYFYNPLGCNPADDVYKGVYSRDYIYTEVVDTIPNVPAGGFTYDSLVVVGPNTLAKWVRASTVVFPPYYARLLGGYDPCYTDINSTYFSPIFDVCDGLLYYASVCNETTATITIDNAQNLFCVIEKLFNAAQCDGRGVKKLVSDFFEWNPVGDAPNYVAGQNYVYGDVNYYNNLAIVQKSDVTRYNATDNATTNDIDLREVLEWLRNEMNLYWFIDDNGDIRIEHISYFFTIDKSVINGEQIFKANAKIPALERWENMEQFNIEFTGTPIRYACYTTSEILYENSRLSTEIDQALLNPEAFEDDGWFVLALDVSDYVINGIGILCAQQQSNTPMSRTQLNHYFFKHYRYDETFEMNLLPAAYIDIMHPLFTHELFHKACCDDDFTDKIKLTTSTTLVLPPRFGQVTETEMDLKTGVMRIKAGI